MRRGKKLLCWSLVVAAALSLIWLAGSTFATRDLEPSQGDGLFTNTSWRFPWKRFGIWISGYTVKFPQFDLASPFDATYRIERLPSIGKDAVIYLCVADPKNQFRTRDTRERLGATIEITVVGAKGKPVCHVKKPVAKMVWANPEGGANTYGLYSIPESYFTPGSNEKYRIQIRYVPDAQLSDLEGFIWIRCGGSI